MCLSFSLLVSDMVRKKAQPEEPEEEDNDGAGIEVG